MILLCERKASERISVNAKSRCLSSLNWLNGLWTRLSHTDCCARLLCVLFANTVLSYLFASQQFGARFILHWWAQSATKLRHRLCAFACVQALLPFIIYCRQIQPSNSKLCAMRKYIQRGFFYFLAHHQFANLVEKNNNNWNIIQAKRWRRSIKYTHTDTPKNNWVETNG